MNGILFSPVSFLMAAIKWTRGVSVLIFSYLKSTSCQRDTVKLPLHVREAGEGGWTDREVVEIIKYK